MTVFMVLFSGVDLFLNRPYNAPPLLLGLGSVVCCLAAIKRVVFFINKPSL